jgi:DNA modification methylase
MKLTDNDKREIIQLIQENKTLPDKYRFLLFEGREEIELLWNGKNNDITDIILPFQTIEHIDEPREEDKISLQGNLFDESGRQLRGWSNKLIWGNNSLILSSLIHGPMFDEIKKEGGLKLVYIDPPFNVGDDFHIDIKIEGNQFEKKRSILEEIAYRDTWGKGSDSFLSMIYERLSLIKQLLADDGSIYVHCDWRLNSSLRMVMDEIFGEHNFLNEIIWAYRGMSVSEKHYTRRHDSILFYKKGDNYTFNWQDISEDFTEVTKKKYKHKDKDGRLFRLHGRNIQGSPIQNKTDIELKWLKSNPDFCRVDYLDEKKGTKPRDWLVMDYLNVMSDERLDYPTQKPEALIERIIKASSNENDLIADFFCGSGTTLSVAEKLNRKWIGCDLGKFATHISRKRLISVQRLKKNKNQNYRAFEILNLGKYQRESFISNTNSKLNKNKEDYFIELILSAYNAEKINNQILHGIKNNRYVYIGPINLHISRVAVEKVVNECVKNQITKVDILCFDHEQGLFPNIINEAKEKGVDINCKIIPPDVFDKRAIDKNQIVFHDVAYIEFKTKVKKNKISIELTGFSVDYSQEKIDEVLSELGNKKSKVILNSGQIIKISRDKNGIEKKEILTKSWKDWIDYWAVDFDFENKKEFFKKKSEDGNIEEVWTGDYVFENEWQSFKTKDTNMEFVSAEKEFASKKFTKIAVKVIDIFGNDTMKVLKVNL